MKSRVSKIPALTGLRAVAAFWVLALHFGDGVTTGWPAPLRNLFSSGFIGVDLFFVLSGFILSWNYLDADRKLTVGRSEFWAARAARILPVYYLSLALSLPLFLLMEFHNGVTPAAIGNTIFTALTSLTLTQSWAASFSNLWNNPGWSLSVEAFFYLAFPFIAARIAAWPLPKLVRVTAGIYLLTVASGYAFVALHSHPPTWKWDPQVDYSIWIAWLGCNPLVHLHEFLMGILVFAWLRSEQSGQQREFMTGTRAVWLAIGAIALLTAWHRATPFMTALMGVHSPLFALLIYGLAKQKGAIARLLSTRCFVFLGEISYSLYLTHLTVWMNVEGFNREHPYIRQNSMLNFLLCLALSLTVAAAFYKFIEEPNRHILRTRFAKFSRPANVAEVKIPA